MKGLQSWNNKIFSEGFFLGYSLSINGIIDSFSTNADPNFGIFSLIFPLFYVYYSKAVLLKNVSLFTLAERKPRVL